MKKLICTMLAAALLATMTPLTFAEEVKASESQFQNMTLTVEGAVSYALANSLTLRQKEAELKKCGHEETQARRTYNDYNSSGMSVEEALVESGYAYRAAQIQKNMAQRNLESEKSAIKTTVKKNFYTCLNYKAKIDAASENYENAKNKYEYAQTKYEQGTISQLELKTFKLSVSKAQLSLNEVKRNAELAERELKNTLNLSEATQLTLLGEFVLPELTYADDKQARELIKGQNSYLSISEGRELAELRFKIAGGWYSSNEVGYSVEYQTYTSAVAGYAEAENSLNYSVASAYYGLQNAKESLEVMAESTELLKNSAEAAFMQYELGMMTADEYVEKEQEYYNTKNSYIDTQLAYYTGVLEYITLYNGSADI